MIGINSYLSLEVFNKWSTIISNIDKISTTERRNNAKNLLHYHFATMVIK